MDDLISLMERQREAGEEGMEAAAGHAERECDGWKDTAYAYLCAFARATPVAFLAEDIAPYAAEHGCPPPPDKRAWGQIIKRAGKDRVIEQTGLAAKNRRSGNASTWRPLWRTVQERNWV